MARSQRIGLRQRRTSVKKRHRIRHRRLLFQLLEGRRLLAVYTVTNTADSGDGSLRQALLEANAASEPSTIQFQIPASDTGFVDADAGIDGGDASADVFVIRPQSALPSVSNSNHAVTISGRSQAAFGGDTNGFGPEIVLDGGALVNPAIGLQLVSNNNQVDGLTINNFGQRGILIEGDGNLITGNYIGTDPTGRQVARNGTGIFISDASFNTIGGTDPVVRNVIAGNAVNLRVVGETSNGNVIQGNYIGVDANGTTAVTLGWRTGTNNDGILLNAGRGTVIGGAAPGAGNVIGGHWEQAIWINGTSAANQILGNRIGATPDGNAIIDRLDGSNLANLRGILIEDSPGNVIGGSVAGAGNIISGNYNGVEIRGTASTGQQILGNFVGTNASGTAALADQGAGILLDGVSGAVIGGLSASAGNLVSGNARSGISILNGSSDTVVQGNTIGTTADGQTAPGNSAGIDIDQSWNSLVGGSATGAGNLISGNVNGVIIDNVNATGNRVQGNTIGTNREGNAPLGQIGGVSLGYGATNNVIGTDGDGIDDAAEGNLISGNSGSGVFFGAMEPNPT